MVAREACVTGGLIARYLTFVADARQHKMVFILFLLGIDIPVYCPCSVTPDHQSTCPPFRPRFCALPPKAGTTKSELLAPGSDILGSVTRANLPEGTDGNAIISKLTAP